MDAVKLCDMIRKDLDKVQVYGMSLEDLQKLDNVCFQLKMVVNAQETRTRILETQLFDQAPT